MKTIAAVLFVWALLSAPGVAEEAITAIAPPVWTVGDTWTLRLRDGTATTTYEVLGAAASGYTVSRTASGDVSLMHVGRDLVEPGYSYWHPAWPLVPGRSWTYTKTGVEIDAATPHEYTNVYTVAGAESVTVPAGTFQAIRIHGRQCGASRERQNICGDFDVWYAPQVKFRVKVAWGPEGSPRYWAGFAHPEELVSYRVAGARPATGSAIASGAPAPGLAVSERTARLLGIRQGDVLQLAAGAAGPWTPARIERVYRPVLYPSELALRSVDIRMHLPDLQSLLGGADEVDSIVVRLRHPEGAQGVAARLDDAGLGVRAYTSADLARRNSGTFEVVARFHRAIGAVTIVASGVFLLTIMALRGEEMRRQAGLMRLVGISRTTIAASVLFISTGIVLLGTAAGIGLGYALSEAINAYYRYLFDTDLRFSQITAPLLEEVALLSLALGLGAGALTAWRLLRRRPLDQIGR